MFGVQTFAYLFAGRPADPLSDNPATLLPSRRKHLPLFPRPAGRN